MDHRQPPSDVILQPNLADDTIKNNIKFQYPQLADNSTWDMLLSVPLGSSSSESNSIRILVENTENGGRDVEGLARMAAFAHHNVLAVPQNDKSIVWNWTEWAKPKDYNGLNPSEAQTNKSRLALVEAVTLLNIDNSGDREDATKNDKIEIVVSPPLSKSQQGVYETASQAAKIQLVQSMTMSVAASSLLQLRRACFHTSLVDGIASEVLNFDGNENAAIHERIKNNSSKLAKLEELLNSELGRKGGKRRVVILCSLPDALHLTHVFLKSAGIHHLKVASTPSTNGEGDGDYAASWIYAQQAISSFNSSDSSEAKILLSSVVTVSGFHGGLACTCADLVISLDEDWSGRQSFLYEKTLLPRCSDAKIIKVVAGGTFEEKVWGGSSSSIFTCPAKRKMLLKTVAAKPSSAITVKLDTNGLICADGKVPILGNSLSGIRGSDLAKLLNVKLSENLSFLPPVDLDKLIPGGDNATNTDIQLGTYLSGLENKACPLSFSHNHSNNNSSSSALIIAPPPPNKFLPFVASRTDTFNMPVRKYVRRLCCNILAEDSTEEISPQEMKLVRKRWLNLGFGCSVDEVAANTLTYDLGVGVSKKEQQKEKIRIGEKADLVNIYSVAYSNLRERRNPATATALESLHPMVYPPPIIPGLLPHSEALMHSKGGLLHNANRDEFVLLPHQRNQMPKASAEVMRGHMQQREGLAGAAAASKSGLKDYGMCGGGLLLSAKDAALIASHTSIETAPYRHMRARGDREGQMLLYVNKDAGKAPGDRKRKRNHYQQPQQQGNDGIQYETPEEASARARAESRHMHVSKQFKIVSDVALQTSLRSNAGPGVPVLFSRSKNPRVPQMILEKDAAEVENNQLKLAENMRGLFRRSVNNPGPNVDLGPNGGGFLSMQSGHSGVTAPRPVSGISLPMGVSLREQETSFPQSEAFDDSEDEEIASSCLTFGFNWHIASASASRKTGKKRSARQCLERWQTIIQNNPAVANNVKKKDAAIKSLQVLKAEDTTEMSLKELMDIKYDKPMKKKKVGVGVEGEDGETVAKVVTPLNDLEKGNNRLNQLPAELKRKIPPPIPDNGNSKEEVAPHESHQKCKETAVKSAAIGKEVDETVALLGNVNPLWIMEITGDGDRGKVQQFEEAPPTFTVVKEENFSGELM